MNISTDPSNPSNPLFAYRYISMKEVCALTGYSRTHIYRLEREGRFPRRRKLGLAKIGFLLKEVLEWLDNRPSPDLPNEFG